eukprot:2723271-Pleurochrysis_carterae.AAC.5
MRLRSRARRFTGLVHAAHLVDQTVHDRAIAILSCALDPVRAACFLTSCIISLASRMKPMKTDSPALVPPRSPAPKAPLRQRTSIAEDHRLTLEPCLPAVAPKGSLTRAR